MATSFRLPPEQMTRLEYLAKAMCKSKAKVVRQAIDRLYEEQMSKSRHSALDRLTEGGFKPLPIDLGDLSCNEARQRKVIGAKLAKKSRD